MRTKRDNECVNATDSPASPYLIGRDAELAQIKSALDGVAQQGGTVRLAGNPGVGKSALLRAGMELAIGRGYTPLSLRAAEGEAHLSFAALYQLLRPLLGRIDELPAGHRAALMGAFGLTEPGTGPAHRRPGRQGRSAPGRASWDAPHRGRHVPLPPSAGPVGDRSVGLR